MPISFNLASNIQEALEQSEFLILMCSPNSIKSEWVQREVETFLKSHSKEQVLTVLLEGEPEKVFPEVLCYEERKAESEDGTEQTVKVKIEPMAADIRGKDKSEIKKKIEQESLRILAKMLGCTYNTLRQRHREYALHRMIWVALPVWQWFLRYMHFTSPQRSMNVIRNPEEIRPDIFHRFQPIF